MICDITLSAGGNEDIRGVPSADDKSCKTQALSSLLKIGIRVFILKELFNLRERTPTHRRSIYSLALVAVLVYVMKRPKFDLERWRVCSKVVFL